MSSLFGLSQIPPQSMLPVTYFINFGIWHEKNRKRDIITWVLSWCLMMSLSGGPHLLASDWPFLCLLRCQFLPLTSGSWWQQPPSSDSLISLMWPFPSYDIYLNNSVNLAMGKMTARTYGANRRPFCSSVMVSHHLQIPMLRCANHTSFIQLHLSITCWHFFGPLLWESFPQQPLNWLITPWLCNSCNPSPCHLYRYQGWQYPADMWSSPAKYCSKLAFLGRVPLLGC